MSVCIYVSYTSLSVIVNFVSIYCTYFKLQFVSGFSKKGEKRSHSLCEALTVRRPSSSN